MSLDILNYHLIRYVQVRNLLLFKMQMSGMNNRLNIRNIKVWNKWEIFYIAVLFTDVRDRNLKFDVNAHVYKQSKIKNQTKQKVKWVGSI